MIPPQFTSQLAQRLSKAVVIGGMALGVGATVLAPAPASAAPSESFVKGTLPDLFVLTLDFLAFETGQSREIGITVGNRGTLHSHRTNLKIVTGTGFISPFAGAPSGSGVRCNPMRRAPSGNGVINCTIEGISPGKHRELSIAMTARAAGERWMRTTIDSENNVDEKDETNNTVTENW